MLPRQEWIHGYHAPIYRGLWERILKAGAPMGWTVLWGACCGYLLLFTFVVFSVRVYLAVLVAWPIGQGVLVLLTKWDAQWDQVLIAKVLHRYRDFYEAG